VIWWVVIAIVTRKVIRTSLRSFRYSFACLPSFHRSLARCLLPPPARTTTHYHCTLHSQTHNTQTLAMSDEDQPRLVQEHPLAALPPESSSGTNTISRSPSSSSSSSATSSKTSLWNYATDIERTVNAIVSHGAFPPSVYRALTAQQESVIKIDESLATHATEPLASLRLPVHLHDHTNESLAKAASSSSSRKSDSDSTDDETLSSMPSREASGKIWRRSSAPTTGQDWIIKLVNEAIARQQLEQLSQANADTTTATSNSTSTNSINHSSPNDLIAQEPEPLDRDWHDEFQALRSRYRAHNLVGSSNAALEAVKQIQYLQQEFDLEAQHTASTIIAERNREQKLRTIKQLNGLEHHYYHNGIFYRVCRRYDCTQILARSDATWKESRGF